MPTIEELKREKDQNLGRTIVELAQAAPEDLVNRDVVSATLKMVGVLLITDRITYPEVHQQLHQIWKDVNDNNPKTSVARRYYTTVELSETVRPFANRLSKLSQDFTTPLSNINKGYRAGSIGHGVLQMLSLAPRRAKELKALWKVLNDSSTLTHMRRDGLIAKASEETVSPFVITELGRRLLEERGEYTLAMYRKSNYSFSWKMLPWQLQADKFEKFVDKQTKGRAGMSC